jgi:hypothetical protein
LRLTPLLNLPAPGRRQTLYVVFDLAESCVFDKQSLGPFHCDRRVLRGRTPTHATAHLLPKLRCQIAEFLRKGSLKRLGILSPSTCVGLRYGLRFESPSRFFLAAWSRWLCGPKASRSRLDVGWKSGFTYPSRLHASTHTSNGGPIYPSASPLDQLLTEVQEY